MGQGQLYSLLDLHNFIFKSADVTLLLQRRLIDFHAVDTRVSVTLKDAHDGLVPASTEHRNAREESLLVHDREDRYVSLRPLALAHDGMVLVDDFF